MIVSRISEINNFTSTEKPIGWLVREKFNDDGKAVGLEFGCYLKDDIFISVPIHFSLKDRFIPMNSVGAGTNYKYYAIPTDMELAVSTYTSKKGKVCPILVAPNDKAQATFISCLARDEVSPNVIINATIDEGSKIVRKYVDKERSVIGIIAFKADRGVINPSTEIELTTGVPGSHTINKNAYRFENTAPSTVSDTETVDYDVKTQFINLPSFVDEKTGGAKHHDKNKGSHKKYTKNDEK